MIQHFPQKACKFCRNIVFCLQNPHCRACIWLIISGKNTENKLFCHYCESGSQLDRLLEPSSRLDNLPCRPLKPLTVATRTDLWPLWVQERSHPGQAQTVASPGTQEACRGWGGGEQRVRNKSQKPVSKSGVDPVCSTQAPGFRRWTEDEGVTASMQASGPSREYQLYVFNNVASSWFYNSRTKT